MSGPVVADSRQPPLYRMAALPAGDTIEWSLRFRLTGFGPITVQPLLTLPAKSLVLPGELPRLSLPALPGPDARSLRHHQWQQESELFFS